MTYKNYSWSAFAEHDLLAGGRNGRSISVGDKFNMPKAASVELSVRDDDDKLSGDRCGDISTDNGQKAFVNGHTIQGRDMYVEKVFTLCGSDGKIYKLAEIEIERYNAPGKGDDFFSFLGDVPPTGITLRVANAHNVTGDGIAYADLMVAPIIDPKNKAPVFDNIPKDGIFHINENTTRVFDIDASDADGDAVTFSLVPGADSAAFAIDPQTGELSFINAPDFEAPTDGFKQDNIYDVTIRADDGRGGVTEKAVWVKVKDVAETNPCDSECIIIEAETMNMRGFCVQAGVNASEGALVRLAHLGGHGQLSTTFEGADGTYDLSLFVQDESDGQSTIYIKVNGKIVATVDLDQDSDGGGSNNGSFSKLDFPDIALKTGDNVSLFADGDGCEYMRIDRIELCQDGEECPEGFTLLDFEGPAAGTVVSTQFDGVTVTAQRDRRNTDHNDAMIFDSANPTGDDADLGFEDQGNILIVSEDNDSDDPDDAVGGKIGFDFDNPSDLHDIKVFDIEEEGGTITLTFASGATKVIAIPALGDNSVQTIGLKAADVTRMEINFVGSGAIDDLCWAPGEEPAPTLGGLSGRVFLDADGDGIDETDTGVAGVVVALVDATGADVGFAATGADGSYVFTALTPGDYTVRFPTSVNGRVLVDQDVGGDDAVDSDANPATGVTAPVVVVAGITTPDVDAGIADSGTAALEGRIFIDANDDSIDNAEMGVPDVLVTLLDGDGNTVATTTTGADGSYSFGGLDAGTYIVDFPEEVDGKVLVDANVGDDDRVDSDAEDGGRTAPIILGIGDAVSDVDAGFEDPGTAALTGRFFVDDDKDDLEDEDDTGVSNATIQLILAGVVVATTTTNANGEYAFTDLDAGDYEVRFVNPGDLDFVTPNVGTDTAIDSDAIDNGDGTATTAAVSVAAGQIVTDVDAGLVDPATGSIGDTVFVDNNDNGVFDDGDTTLSGVTVTLFDDDGAEITVTTTADDGTYLFDGLAAGTYVVGFDEVDGFDFIAPGAGADTVDSDADPVTGLTDDIVLGIGDDDDTVDAGFVPKNTDPIADDDEGAVCALETTTLDVLSNDSDVDGGGVVVATVNGVSLSSGQTTTLVSGAIVTLNADGTLGYDSTNAVIDGVSAQDMLIGSTYVDSFDYSISDGQGGADDATVQVSVKGALNTIDTIIDVLPTRVTSVQAEFRVGLGYATTVEGSGNAAIDGIQIEAAYCIERTNKFIQDIDVTMDVRAGIASENDDGQFTNSLVENIDALNWLLNQNFISQSNGDTTGASAGENYTHAEIQHAIWGLTDGDAEMKIPVSVGGFYNGTQANVDELLARALAEGEGFEAGEGDLLSLILDPTEVQVGYSEADDYDQAFIVTVAYEDYLQECIC